MLYIIEKLKRSGFTSYFVGSCVRDIIMAETPDKYNFATNAKIDDISKIFKEDASSIVSKDRIVFNIDDIKCTVDSYYGKNTCIPGYTGPVIMKPTVYDYLERKDFTIDAIAYSFESGYINPYKGLEDISGGIIRCINDPDTTIKNNPISILRAIRMFYCLGYRIDYDTKVAIVKNIELINTIPESRYISEIKRAFNSDELRYLFEEYSKDREKMSKSICYFLLQNT